MEVRGRSRKNKGRATIRRQIRAWMSTVLTAAMIIGNMATSVNTVLASPSVPKEEFRLRAAAIQKAAEKALDEGIAITEEILIDGKDKTVLKEYQELFKADGRLYELDLLKDIETVKDVSGVTLRVFMRLPEEADPKTHVLNGDEELYFLYVNDGDESVSARLNIEGLVSGFSTVRAYEAVFGEKEKILENQENLENQGKIEETSGVEEETATNAEESKDIEGIGESKADEGGNAVSGNGGGNSSGGFGGGSENSSTTENRSEDDISESAGDKEDKKADSNDTEHSSQEENVEKESDAEDASKETKADDADNKTEKETNAGIEENAGDKTDEETGTKTETEIKDDSIIRGDSEDSGKTDSVEKSEDSGKTNSVEKSETSETGKTDNSSSKGEDTDSGNLNSKGDQGKDSTEGGSSSSSIGERPEKGSSDKESDRSSSDDRSSSNDNNSSDNRGSSEGGSSSESSSKDKGDSDHDDSTGDSAFNSLGISLNQILRVAEPDVFNETEGEIEAALEETEDTVENEREDEAAEEEDTKNEEIIEEGREETEGEDEKVEEESTAEETLEAVKETVVEDENESIIRIENSDTKEADENLNKEDFDSDDDEDDKDFTENEDSDDGESAATVEEKDPFEKKGVLEGKTHNLVAFEDGLTARVFTTTLEKLGMSKEDLIEGGHILTYTVSPAGSAVIINAPELVRDESEVTFGVMPQIGYRIVEVTANGEALGAVNGEILASGSNAQKELASASNGNKKSVEYNEDEIVYFTIPRILESQAVEIQMREEVEGSHPEFNEAKTINGVTISVSAQEGILPEGTYLTVEEVTEKVEGVLTEKLAQEEEMLNPRILAYDINLMVDGKKLSNERWKDDYVSVHFSGKKIEEFSKDVSTIKIMTLETPTIEVEAAFGETEEMPLLDDVKAEDIGWKESEVTTVDVSEENSINTLEYKAEHFTTITLAAYNKGNTIVNEEDAYFYILRPGNKMETATGDKENYPTLWYYAGMGKINPASKVVTSSPEVGGDYSFECKEVKHYEYHPEYSAYYPEQVTFTAYPTITYKDKNYRYRLQDDAKDGKWDGTYDVVWDNIPYSGGANCGDHIITNDWCYHVNGYAVFSNSISAYFQVKNPTEDSFTLLEEWSQMLDQEGEFQRPNDIESIKVQNEINYYFDGWYLDEDCTQLAKAEDFRVTNADLEKDFGRRIFYGKYVSGKELKYTFSVHKTLEGYSEESEDFENAVTKVRFQLEKLDGKSWVPVTASDGSQSWAPDNSGDINYNLPEGNYRLREITSADGYKCLEEVIEFKIVLTGEKIQKLEMQCAGKENAWSFENGILKVINHPDSGIVLPDTGGPGLGLIKEFGWVLLLIALMMAGMEVQCYGDRRKKVRTNESKYNAQKYEEL